MMMEKKKNGSIVSGSERKGLHLQKGASVVYGRASRSIAVFTIQMSGLHWPRICLIV